jgi:hypothetical protein
MALRDTLRKAAGLLVELPPGAESLPPKAGGPTTAAEVDRLLAELGDTEGGAAAGATKTVDQIVREAPGPNLDEIKVADASLEPIVGGDGKADFGPIYRQSGLPPAPFTAEQMLEMLASLPPELPLDTKRQTVKVTLNAMGKTIGATPETIVADASRKLAALTAYMDHLTKETADSAAAAQQEITALQAQIEEKRRSIETAQQKQAQMRQLCDAESDRLDDVLEFFSLDLPPSKYAAGSEPTASS